MLNILVINICVPNFIQIHSMVVKRKTNIHQTSSKTFPTILEVLLRLLAGNLSASHKKRSYNPHIFYYEMLKDCPAFA